MTLDLTTFEKALGQLERSLRYLESPAAAKDHDLYQQFRAAAIQAFEYCYELAMKMIRRQLAQIVANPSELREMAFMDLVRTAADAGLVRDVPAFKVYREMRNTTSHTYEEERAEDVASSLGDFMEEMRFLLAELKRRNHATD